MSLKNPVTPPGIDPGTVRLVAQRLIHYVDTKISNENLPPSSGLKLTLKSQPLRPTNTSFPPPTIKTLKPAILFCFLKSRKAFFLRLNTSER